MDTEATVAVRTTLNLVSASTHVNFWGVRGSTPCDGHQFDRYGGNTSCVEIA